MRRGKLERDEEMAIWTTAGFRPMAEPPIVNWEQILEKEFSVVRLPALFAENPEKINQAKDVAGEKLALTEYQVFEGDVVRRC